MSTADVTSGAERPARAPREKLEFGTIIIVGGGCYGSYYVRQLGRAFSAGAAAWKELLVVDHDGECQVAQLASELRPPSLRLAIEPWSSFFESYLESETDRGSDAIVPSPLMPHLFADWIVSRARARWPDRPVTRAAVGDVPGMPWQRAGDDATHYVSFADWMCPINCVEPATCPHTKEARDWSMPISIGRHGGREASFVFRCLHRTHGVGMIDVSEILAADAAISAGAARGAAQFLVGTASHCHGAVQRVVVGD